MSQSNISTVGSQTGGSAVGSDTRKKQSKKDESLRKKIESDLARKRPTPHPTQSTTPQPASSYNASRQRRSQPQKGTVASLRPSPALTVPESMSVSDASQLCAAKRTDCVLVVDEEEGLSGIFTAKDLAFRVTAASLDPRNTPVSAIMTKNPMVTRDTTSATQALELMVQRGFRHLPVCNEDGDVVGLLDITKVFHEALSKVERSSAASSQLHAALAGVQSELGPGLSSNPQAAAMMAYVEALKEKMALPDLTTVMERGVLPAMVNARTTVREAAKLMKERRTTAVCVMEGGGVGGEGGKIAGIFTSKDVVLRVIAAGLDASRCSVVRVMTPHPDTAPPTMSVQDALKKMHVGHYLNLPVVESDGRLVGIVDVLKLTYATLEQIESMSEDKSSNEGGPMWGKFFDDLGNNSTIDDETASHVSGSLAPLPSTPIMPKHLRQLSSVTSPTSEIAPGDSASVVDEGASEVGPGVRVTGPASSVAPAPPVDDGTYIFKFKTPSGQTHRFQARNDQFENLQEIVGGKLLTDPFFSASAAVEGAEVHLPDPTAFQLQYTDDDGDLVTMTTDGDVTDAVRIARSQRMDRVVLFVNGGKVWEEAAKDINGAKGLEVLKEASMPTPAEEKEEKALEAVAADPANEATYGQSEKVHAKSEPVVGKQQLIKGVPDELLLPGAVGFLGVVIIVVFMMGRSSK